MAAAGANTGAAVTAVGADNEDEDDDVEERVANGMCGSDKEADDRDRDDEDEEEEYSSRSEVTGTNVLRFVAVFLSTFKSRLSNKFKL